MKTIAHYTNFKGKEGVTLDDKPSPIWQPLVLKSEAEEALRNAVNSKRIEVRLQVLGSLLRFNHQEYTAAELAEKAREMADLIMEDADGW